MLYIGYLIIVDGHNIKKISFGNFHYWAAEARDFFVHTLTTKKKYTT